MNSAVRCAATGRRSEFLEDRMMLTGQLAAQLVNGAEAHVLVNPGTGDEIQVFGDTAADQNAAAAFFTAADGAAGTATIDGRIVANGEEVSGTFTFTEFATGGGVAVEANDVSVRLGDTVGVELSDADGVFAIQSDGFAGQVDVTDTGGSDDIEVFGLNGLQLDSAFGLQFEINTTDSAVDRTVSTIGGDVSIDLAANTEQIVGPGEFRVDGVLGPVAKTSGAFTITENGGDEGNLTIAAANVRATLAVGDVNAATVASQTATFSLGVDVDPETSEETPAFRLANNSFVVGGFLLLPNGTETVDPTNGGVGGRAVLNKASLGPLSLAFVGMSLPTFELVGDQFAIAAGLDASFHPKGAASLTFNDPDLANDPNPLKVEASKPKGSIEIRGDVGNDGLVDTALLPGKFTLAASKVTLNIPDLLEATAAGSPTFTWDPSLGLDQDIFKTNLLNVEIEPVELKGSFQNTADNPALLVRGDGFAFGRGTVTLDNFEQDIGIATIVDPFVRLSDFTFSIDDGISLGEFAVGAQRLRLEAGSGDWSVEGQNVTASVTLTDSFFIDDVKFTVGSIVGTLGDYFEFSTTDTTFKPTASGDEEVLRVAGSIAAKVEAGPINVSGSMSRFSIQADGDFKPLENFKVSLGLGVTKASSFLWPEFVPLQLDEIAVRWPNFETDPGNFQVLFSGGVNGTLPANIASLTGTVKDLIIDVDKLVSGEFPIISVGNVTIAASGEFLGGRIEGALFMGVIKLDEEGNRLPDGASTFDDTVIYGGIQGGFTFPALGRTDIRIALSELGPLSAYISAGPPVPVDPTLTTGLAIKELRGGITFNATPIQAPSSPADLVGSAFKPQTSLTADQWRDRAVQQVANLATGGSGFIFDHGVDIDDTITALNLGGVSGGGSFEKNFKDRGFPIGNAFKRPKVTTIEFDSMTNLGKKWHISIGDQHYIAEVKGEISSRKVRVSAVNFTAPIEIADELTDGGNVPASLVSEFSAHRVRIDTGFNVEVTRRATNPDGTDGAPIRWKLFKSVGNDEVREYFVQKHTGDGGLLSVTGDGGVFSDLGLGDFRVEVGGTLISTHVTDAAFEAAVDLTMTSDSKYILNGKFEFGTKFSADTTAFFDFGASDPNGNLEPRLIMLADFPGSSSGLPRVARLQGDVSFVFRNEDGEVVEANKQGIESIRSFTLEFKGRGELTALEVAKVVIGGDGGATGGFGELEATFSVDPDVVKFQLDVKGSVGIEGIIPADDLVSGAGQLVFEAPTNGDSPKLYGGLKLDFDTNQGGLSFLEDLGLKADAEILLVVNATNDVQEIDLALPGRPIETFFLEALTLGFEMQGSLTLGQNIAGFGAQLVFDGVFGAAIRIDENGTENSLDDTFDFELFLTALLTVDAQAVGQNLNLMTLDAMGVFVARDMGLFNIVPDLAGRIDLVGATGIPGVMDITTGDAPATLQFNTTGLDQTYEVPERLRDRLAVIQGRRENKDPGDVVIPPTTIQGGQNITIPATPPPLLTGQVFAAGPYFFINFGGDPTDETDDAGITFLNAFKLQGDFRVVASLTGGLELIVNARAGADLPGLQDLIQVNQTAQGIFRINQAGIVGALTIDGDIDLGGLIDIEADIFLGINTTTTNEAVTLTATNGSTQTHILQSESAEVLVQGDADIAGFELDGEFRIFAQGGEMQFSIDAGIDFFDIAGLRIQETAVIETGAGVGLTLDAPLDDGVKFDFGQPGIFEASGELRLVLDTLNNKAEIRVEDLELDAFEVIELSGNGRVSAHTDATTGEQFLRLNGDLQGELFDLVDFDVEGFYDSRGYVDLTLRGGVEFGGSSFGIRGNGQFHIVRDESIPLDVSGSGRVRVRAFGQDVGGISLDVDYNGGTGEIEVSATIEVEFEVDLGPFGGFDVEVVDETIGPYTIGFIGVGEIVDPRLGVKDGDGGLILNVGDRADQRNLEPDVIDEPYIIQTLGPGTERGQKIMVRSFGSKQIFDDITSITGDFGSGNDQLRIDEKLGDFAPISVAINGGAGQDFMTNESSMPVTFHGGDDDDVLVSSIAGDVLNGDGGNDNLIGSLGDDILRGGSGDDMLEGNLGNDTLLGEGGHDRLDGGQGIDIVRGGTGDDHNIWAIGDGIDTEFTGGAGIDRVVVKGGLLAETYDITVADLTTVNISGGVTTSISMDAEEVGIFAGGGADTINVTSANADDLVGVFASLGRLDGGRDDNGDVISIDDNTADVVSLQTGSADDVFSIDTVGDAIRVVRDGFTLGILDTTPDQDRFTIDSAGGNDQFTVAGPALESAGTLLKMQLLGGAGNDSFTLPVGTVPFDGQAGIDDVTFTISPGDSGDVSLNALNISQQFLLDGRPTTSYGDRAESLTLTATRSLDLNVGSTIAGNTIINSLAGGDTTLAASTGPVTINGSGSNQLVTLGGPSSQRLSTLRSNVVVNNAQKLTFRNNSDTVDRTIILNDSELTGVGDFRTLTHSGIRSFDLQLGRGNNDLALAITDANMRIDAGPGINSVTATASGKPGAVDYGATNSPVLEVLRSGSIEFTNINNNLATDWLLDQNQLTADGIDFLAAPVNATLDLTLGAGDGDTVQLLRVDSVTDLHLGGTDNVVTFGGTIDLGAGGSVDVTLDDIDADTRLSGTPGANNQLVLDDTRTVDQAGAPRIRVFDAQTINGTDANGELFVDSASYSSITALFGDAIDHITLNNTINVSFLELGGSDDRVSTKGTVGDLQIAGQSGNDLVTVSAAAGSPVDGGTVTFRGGADADEIRVDRSDAVNPVTGGFAASSPAVITVGGLPTVTLPEPIDVEQVTVLLGEGNDTFDINNATAELNFDLLTGLGDDAITVTALAGAADSHRVNGQGGDDSVLITIPGTPLANQFTQLAPTAEVLQIDNTANGGNVDWLMSGTLLSANGLDVIDTDGSDLVRLLAGTGGNSLEASSGATTNAVEAIIDGQQVILREGANVLTAADEFRDFNVSGTIAGLENAQLVEASADGQLFFASGDDNAIAVFRRDGASLQVVEAFRHEDLNAPTALAISDDGESLYVAATNAAGDAKLLVLAIGSGGSLRHVQSIDLTTTGDSIDVSPDGLSVAVIENISGTVVTPPPNEPRPQQFIGIDFGSSDDVSPTNWNFLRGNPDFFEEIVSGSTISSLIDETGTATPFGFAVTTSDGENLGTDSYHDLSVEDFPQHTQPLDELGGNIYDFAPGGSLIQELTFTFTNLASDSTYEVYVFGYDPTHEASQAIVVNGAGDPISFTQDVTNDGLIVNSETGIDTRTLESYAVSVAPTVAGTITIEVDERLLIAGLMLRETKPPLPIEPPTGDPALTTFVRSTTNGELSDATVFGEEVSQDLAAAELENATDLQFTSDSRHVLVKTKHGYQTFARSADGQSFEWLSQLADNPGGLPISATSSMQVSDDGNLLFAVMKPFSNDDPVTLNYYQLSPELDGAPVRLAGTIENVSRFHSLTENSSGDLFEYDDATGVLTVMEFEGKLATYHLQADGTFAFVDRYEFPLATAAAKEAPVDMAYSEAIGEFRVLSVITRRLFSPAQGGNYSHMHLFVVGPDGSILTPDPTVVVAPSGQQFSGQVSWVQFGGPDTSKGRFVTMRGDNWTNGLNPNGISGQLDNAEFVFFDVSGNEDTSVTLGANTDLGFSGGGFINDIEVHPQRSDVIWVAFNTPEQSFANVRAYHLNGNTAGGIVTHDTEGGVAGVAISSTRGQVDIKFTPDGTAAYLSSLANGTTLRWNLPDTSLDSLTRIRTNATPASDGGTDLNVHDLTGGSLAFGNGNLYLSQSSFNFGSASLTVEPLPSERTANFNAQTNFSNGDNELLLDNASLIELSANGSLAYVATTDDKLLTLEVALDDRLQRVGGARLIHELSDDVGGVDGLDDVTGIERFGSQLFVSSAGDDAVAVFNLDASTGLPSFSHIVRDSADGDRRLADVAGVAAVAGSVATVSPAENALTFIAVSSGTLDTPVAFEQGDEFQRPLLGLDAIAQHPTLPLLYGVSTADDALVAVNTTTGVTVDFVDGTEVQSLDGAADLAISPDGKFVVVVSPGDDAIAVFEQPMSGNLEFRFELTSNDTQGLVSVEFISAIEFVAVGGDQLQHFEVGSNGEVSILSSTLVPGADTVAVDGSQLIVGSSSGGTLTTFTRVPPQTGGTGTFVDAGRLFGQGVSLNGGANAPDNKDLVFGDVDGDGDLDIFVVHDDTYDRVWVNQGGIQGGTLGTFEDSGQEIGSTHSEGIALGDLDGDGDLDAFVANRGKFGVNDASEANTVFINQGGDQGGTPGIFVDSGQLLGNGRSSSVSLGDLDGDGDLDAFVANEGEANSSDGEPNRVWFNQGGVQGGTPATFVDSGQTLGLTHTQRIELADIDNDGDLDAVTVNEDQFDDFGGRTSDSDGRVWINAGGSQGGTAGVFTDGGVRLTGTEHAFGLSLGDIDGDGDIDAIVAGAVTRLFLNQGGDQSGTVGTFVASEQTFPDVPFGRDAALADLDGDGDLDAFIASTGGAADRGDRILINQGAMQGGTPGVFLDIGQAVGDSSSHSLALADFDGDGDVDSAVSIGFSGIQLYSNRNDVGSFAADQTIAGLGGVTDIAVTSTNVYAADSTGRITVLSRNDEDSPLAVQQTIVEGENGVRGIDGASSIKVSEDGRFVFVTGRTNDTLAVFTRNATNGQLRFAQLIRDGRSGVSGLGQPTSLFVSGNTLTAGAAAGRGTSRGGFVQFDITQDIVPEPLNVTTEFDSISDLTVTTGPDSDRIRLLNAPDRGEVMSTTINGNAGDDLINLLDASPMLTVNLGSGDDELIVSVESDTTATVNTGADANLINVQFPGLHSDWTFHADNGSPGAGSDVFLIAGNYLPPTSSITINGDTRSAGENAFDAIVYDGDPGAITINDDGSGTAGTITQPGRGSVTYAGFNNRSADPDQIFVKVAPRPGILIEPATIAEGDSVTLTAADLSGGTGTLTYAWDLNGDGEFDDATGAELSLSWDDLRFFGIDDDGTFDVSVQITRTGDEIPQLPAFVLSGIGRAPLVVTNTAPVIQLTADATVGFGELLQVNFAALADPGNDRIIRWTINWGDGTIEEFGSDAVLAQHRFNSVGSKTVTVTATDEDGDHSAVYPVNVVPGPQMLQLQQPTDIVEGDGITLTGSVLGDPTLSGFVVKGSSQAETQFFAATDADSPTVSFTWAQLETLFDADGPDSLLIQLRSDFSGTQIESDEITVNISNVAPTGEAMTSAGTVDEGATTPVTISVTGIVDPSTLDISSGITVSYDFGDTGTFEIQNAAPAAATAIPSSLFATSGELVVRARLVDDDGFRDLFANIVVVDVAPAVQVIPSTTTLNEGETLTLDVTVTDPGNDIITDWIIDWGDGTQTVGTGSIPQQTHTFVDGRPAGSPQNIQVIVSTNEADGRDSQIVTVNDVAPTVTLSTTTPTIIEGSALQPFMLDIAVADPGDDQVAGLIVDWGDGSVETVSGSPTSLSHSYDHDGTFSVSLTEITNGDGRFIEPSNTVSVTVTDTAPQIFGESLNVPATGAEATPVFLFAEAVGSERGIHPLSFNWTITDPTGTAINPGGAGSAFTPTADSNLGSAIGYRSEVQFTPADNGSYQVLLTVTDDDGSQAVHHSIIEIGNQNPSIETFMVPGVANEGETVQLSAIGLDPAAGADPLTFHWLATNVLTGEQIELTGPAPTFLPDGGNYGIELTVDDGDGGTASRTATLIVSSTAPELDNVIVPTTAGETDTVSFSATATDGDGTNDGLTFVWNVEQPEGTVEQLAGPDVQFTFPDDGDFIVSVTVTDNEGEVVSSEPQTVTVGNVDPQLTGSSIPGTGIEGTSINLTASATDVAGSRDPLNFLWTITHPDGSESEVGGTSALFTPPDNGTYDVTLTVDDNDGGQATVSGQIVVSNADPVINDITIPPLAMEGVEQTLSIDVTDVSGDLDNLQVEWILTNSVTSEVTNLSGPQIVFTPAGGNYTVSVNVTDDDSGTATTSDTIRVVSLTVPESSVEGTLINMTATELGNGGAPLTFSWQVEEEGGFTSNFAGDDVSFTPDDNGIFNVTLTTTDGQDQLIATATLTVNNVAPTAALTGPASTTIGEEVTVNIGSVTDPGDDTVTNFVIDWGDGTTSEVVSPGPVLHTYAEPLGAIAISLTLVDEDGTHVDLSELPILIQDFGTVEFSQEDYSVNEDGGEPNVPVAIRRTGNLTLGSTIIVRLSGIEATGSSTNATNADFDDTDLMVEFAPGEDTQTISIPVTSDSVVELNERLALTIIAEENVLVGESGSARLTILNDDVSEITVEDVTVTEGDNGIQQAVVRATLLNDVDAPVRVRLTTADLTAEADSGDFTSRSAQLRFAGVAGETKTFVVDIAGDTNAESDETLAVNLSNLSTEQRDVRLADTQALIRILNDDVSNPVNLSVSSNIATEADGTVITIVATSNSAVSGDQTVTVDVSGIGITAADYTLSDTTITIPDGESSGSVTFTVADDSNVESLVETATVTVTNPSAGIVLGTTTTQEVTITDDDHISDHLGLLTAVGRTAGNVSATVTGPHLDLMPQSGDNGVQVFENAAGDIVVSGLGGSTVNGLPEVIFFAAGGSIPGKLRVFGSTGTLLTAASNLDVTGELAISNGAEENAVELANVTVRQNFRWNGSSGTSHLAADNLNVTGRVDWDATGPATIDVTHSQFASNVLLDTGTADDIIRFTDSRVDIHQSINTGSGTDSVTLDGTTTLGNVNVISNTGNMATTLANVSVSGTTYVSSGLNRDTLSIMNGTFGRFFYVAGEGNNTLTATGATMFNGDAFVSGGSNKDTFSLTGSILATTLTVNTGDGNNQLTVNDSSVIGKSNIVMGDDADTVYMADADLGILTTLQTGATGDNLNLMRTTFAGSVAFDTADGNDTFSSTTMNVTGSLKIDPGNNSDRVTITDGTLQSSLLLFTPIGAGQNTVRLTDTTVAASINLNVVRADIDLDNVQVTGPTIIATPLGADSIDVVNNSVFAGLFNAVTGSADDQLTFSDATFNGNLLLNTQGGMDTVNFTDVTLNAELGINTGTQDDTVNFLRTHVQNRTTLFTGDGIDLVDLTAVDFGTVTNLRTGNGHDTLNLDTATFSGPASLATENGNDTVTGDNIRSSATLTVDLGANNDIFDWNNVTMTAAFLVQPGFGNDAMRLLNSNMDIGTTTFVPVGGYNVIDLQNNTFQTHVTVATRNGAIGLRIKNNAFGSTLAFIGGSSATDALVDDDTSSFATPPTIFNFDDLSNNLIDELFEDLLELAF